MNQNYRRTSIDKFNNRPPFNIKKMDDATSTEYKEQNYQCCNCDRRYDNTTAKSYLNVVKYLEHFGDRYQRHTNNKNKNIIPKIIESFQKITPKRPCGKMRQKRKSESLETIFRNNSVNFGKNLPKHRLMKDLFKQFGNEFTETNNPEPHQQIDMIPSRDISEYPSESFAGTDDTVRVDKKTSTTGLQWPVPVTKTQNHETIVEQSNACAEAHHNPTKLKSKIPQRQDAKNVAWKNSRCKFIKHKQLKNVESRKSSDSSSGLEYFPTKENQLKKADVVTKIPKQVLQNANKAVDNDFPNFSKYKSNPKQDGVKKENTYVLQSDKSRNSDDHIDMRKKEKSFVQLQVEKLNKKSSSNKNVHLRGRSSSKNLRARESQDKKDMNMNKRYISLMTSVRKNLPKIEGKVGADSMNENSEWSDAQANPEGHVRFPRETRTAMEHLMKNLRRVPLSKYAKRQDVHIQPAIPINCHANEEHRDCQKIYSGRCSNRITHLPCSKNLLCERGSNHDGPCTRPETVPQPRYESRLRPANSRGCTK